MRSFIDACVFRAAQMRRSRSSTTAPPIHSSLWLLCPAEDDLHPVLVLLVDHVRAVRTVEVQCFNGISELSRLQGDSAGHPTILCYTHNRMAPVVDAVLRCGAPPPTHLLELCLDDGLDDALEVVFQALCTDMEQRASLRASA